MFTNIVQLSNYENRLLVHKGITIHISLISTLLSIFMQKSMLNNSLAVQFTYQKEFRKYIFKKNLNMKSNNIIGHQY